MDQYSVGKLFKSLFSSTGDLEREKKYLTYALLLDEALKKPTLTLEAQEKEYYKLEGEVENQRNSLINLSKSDENARKTIQDKIQNLREVMKILLSSTWNLTQEISKLRKTRDEFCSTYAGNALLLAALKTKLDATDNSDPGKKEFKNAVINAADTLKTSTIGEHPNAYNQGHPPLLERTVNSLYADVNFRNLMEFGTKEKPMSPVYQKNMSRLLPAEMFQFILSLTENPCSPIISSSLHLGI